MFKEMGIARLAGRLVGRADPVPQHMRDYRRPPVCDDDDLKPVIKSELLGVRRQPRNILRGGVIRFGGRLRLGEGGRGGHAKSKANEKGRSKSGGNSGRQFHQSSVSCKGFDD